MDKSSFVSLCAFLSVEEELLNSLQGFCLAIQNASKAPSIDFPLLSMGNFGKPFQFSVDIVTKEFNTFWFNLHVSSGFIVVTHMVEGLIDIIKFGPVQLALERFAVLSRLSELLDELNCSGKSSPSNFIIFIFKGLFNQQERGIKDGGGIVCLGQTRIESLFTWGTNRGSFEESFGDLCSDFADI